MSRDIADHDPKKWVYTEHARAKHAIQRTYMGAWLPILGRHHPHLIVFDGFAGRGRYEGGERGSPLLFFDRAVEAAEADRVKRVQIRCVELSEQNFAKLSVELGQLQHPRVSIDARRGRFAEQALEAASRLAISKPTPPVFWTADPFGFKGVPLETIRTLMGLKRSEVLLTFMVRDMRRFLDGENHQIPLTEFFGGEAWRECLKREDAESREQCLLLTYSRLIRSEVAKFATPFRVFEDERRQTLYYLVHLTNNALGMRQMKKAMVTESRDMTFWPVTVRRPDQLTLDTEEAQPYPSLQDHLLATYGGRRMTFGELLNTDYPHGLWLEPAYRSALLDLEARQIDIERPRVTPSGQRPRGLKEEDIVTFSSQAQLL